MDGQLPDEILYDDWRWPDKVINHTKGQWVPWWLLDPLSQLRKGNKLKHVRMLTLEDVLRPIHNAILMLFTQMATPPNGRKPIEDYLAIHEDGPFEE